MTPPESNVSELPLVSDRVPYSRPNYHVLGSLLLLPGALKATSNRGLQPAMDHLIENEGKPVPDLSSVTSAASSRPPQGGGDPMDEDDDLEALRAVYGKDGGGSNLDQTEAEAKVR